MKRITAIIAAIALAFAVALGDQIIALSSSGNPLGLNSVLQYFASHSDEPEVDSPTLPVIEELPLPEPSLSYEERVEKGDYYFEREFYSYAANEYVKAINLEPQRSEPVLKLANTNFELGEYDKARKNAEQLLTLQPANFEAEYLIVRTLIRQNQFADAELKIDDLLTRGHTDDHLFYYKALINIAFDRHEEGKDVLKQLQALTLTDSELNDKIFKILAAYTEFEFAESAEDLYLGELLARAFNQIGEYEFAVFKLKDILQQRSDLRDGWILLGFGYLNLEKYLFALTAFERAYNLDSEWPATQYFLGITYSELSKHEDALVSLITHLSNGFEPAAVVHKQLADLYLKLERYDEAVAEYEQVLSFSNQNIDSFVRPIWIYLDFLEQPEKAKRLAETAVLTFPENAMAHNLLGWSQTGTNNFVEAEKNLVKSLTLDPNLPAAHYNLGKLYEELGRDEDALNSFQTAYEIDLNGSIGNLAAKRYNRLLTE